MLPGPKSLAETQNRKDVPTMRGGMGGMDYCSPCKAKTESLFMICRAMFGGEESFLPKLIFYTSNRQGID